MHAHVCQIFLSLEMLHFLTFFTTINVENLTFRFFLKLFWLRFHSLSIWDIRTTGILVYDFSMLKIKMLLYCYRSRISVQIEYQNRNTPVLFVEKTKNKPVSCNKKQVIRPWYMSKHK